MTATTTRIPTSETTMTSPLAISPWRGWSANERRLRRPLRDADGHADTPPPAADTPPPAADTPPADTPPADTPPAADTPPVDPLDQPSTLNAGDPPAGDPPAGEAKPKDGELVVIGAPEAYELQMPEGVTLDAEAFAEAEPILRELNLSNDAANKLAPVAASLVQRGATAAQQAVVAEVVAQRAEWAKQALADTELGGTTENYKASVKLSAKGLDMLGFKGAHKDASGNDVPAHPFRQLLDETGLGNHPEMIRAWKRVGEAVSEPFDLPRPTAAPGTETATEIMYGKK